VIGSKFSKESVYSCHFILHVSINLKIAIQLFATGANFILDFTRVNGDVISFFNSYLILREEMKFC
jgi:hypothetical protein